MDVHGNVRGHLLQVAGKASAPSLLLEMQRRDGLRHKDDQALTSALRGFSALVTATIN